MSRKWKARNRVFIVLAGFFIQPFAQADISAVLPMCTGCHGAEGVGMEANIPTIGGLPATLQEDALNAYKNGDRKFQAVFAITDDDQYRRLQSEAVAALEPYAGKSGVKSPTSHTFRTPENEDLGEYYTGREDDGLPF